MLLKIAPTAEEKELLAPYTPCGHEDNKAKFESLDASEQCLAYLAAHFPRLRPRLECCQIKLITFDHKLQRIRTKVETITTAALELQAAAGAGKELASIFKLVLKAGNVLNKGDRRLVKCYRAHTSHRRRARSLH